MIEESKAEKKNRRTGMMVSVAVHALLLIIFFFLIAYRPPDPPIPQYGIEVNFGLSDAGDGDNQDVTPPGNNNSPNDNTAENTPNEQQEVSEPVNADNAEEALTNDLADGVPMEPADKKEPTPVKKEDKKEQPVKEEKKVNPKAVFDAGGSNNNNGDKPGTVGDQGDPNGSLNSKALYGSTGSGGNGTSIEMTGWVPDYTPKPVDNSSESGKIVYEIKIDSDGIIISIVPVERTVSANVERIYRKEVEKMTFTKKNDNNSAAPISSGRVTFIIKSR